MKTRGGPQTAPPTMAGGGVCDPVEAVLNSWTANALRKLSWAAPRPSGHERPRSSFHPAERHAVVLQNAEWTSAEVGDLPDGPWGASSENVSRRTQSGSGLEPATGHGTPKTNRTSTQCEDRRHNRRTTESRKTGERKTPRVGGWERKKSRSINYHGSRKTHPLL